LRRSVSTCDYTHVASQLPLIVACVSTTILIAVFDSCIMPLITCATRCHFMITVIPTRDCMRTIMSLRLSLSLCHSMIMICHASLHDHVCHCLHHHDEDMCMQVIESLLRVTHKRTKVLLVATAIREWYCELALLPRGLRADMPCVVEWSVKLAYSMQKLVLWLVGCCFDVCAFVLTLSA
jgi:hypothetical protein